MSGARADVAGEQAMQRRLRFALPFAGVWLLVLLGPASDMLDRATSTAEAVVDLALVIAFGVVYLWLVALTWDQRQQRRGRLLLAVLVALAVAIVCLAGPSGFATFIFLAVIVQIVFPWPVALGVTVVVALVPVVVSSALGWADPWSWVFPIAGAALAMFGVARMAERNRAMVDAQQERSRNAVLAERERFARDLHDILGHSLTVITVKSELAGRLVERDPVRAHAEIADIERLARQALADVRATVGNYREVSLAAEIASARSALLAAGIEPELPGAVDDVPPELAETFGYVIREGVTNVVRHSGASTCTVRVQADQVEVIDDGHASCATPEGHGLAGLRARVEAVGGRLEASQLPDGAGFRLLARVGDGP